LSGKVCGAWSAHGGSIGGKNLLIVPDKQIVQAWRARFWKKRRVLHPNHDMTFEKAADGVIVELVHVGVPQHDQKGVRNGWSKYHWKLWQKYLRAGKNK
jgi:hypothetical protein